MIATERVLIFSPHPDDVELFVGGTMLRHVAEGAAVRVIMMTHGEKGSLLSLLGTARQEALRRTRDAELEERYRRIPTVELVHLDFPDRGVRETPDRVDRVLACLQAFGPDTIYLPEADRSTSRYTHPDHLGTGRIVETAARQSARPTRLRYFHSKTPNVFVDVTDFREANLEALRCYRSQYAAATGLPFLLRFFERELQRRTQAYGTQIGTKFAEAFRETAEGV